MIVRLIYFEIKNLLRDQMTLFLIAFPLIYAATGRYLLSLDLEQVIVEIAVVLIVVISGFIYGAMVAFSILDDRDDHVFVSIAISPLSLQVYVWVKILFMYVMSIFSTLFVYAVVGISSLTWMQVVMLATLSGLQVPLQGMLINALASNKVEGFVIMKATGFLLIFPIFGYLFTDIKQWLFAFAPAFWPTKAIQTVLFEQQISLGLIDLGLSYWGFVFGGLLYFGVLIFLMNRIFTTRVLAQRSE